MDHHWVVKAKLNTLGLLVGFTFVLAARERPEYQCERL